MNLLVQRLGWLGRLLLALVLGLAGVRGVATPLAAQGRTAPVWSINSNYTALGGTPLSSRDALSGVAGLAYTRDGRILVADGATNELRVYRGGSGIQVAAFGRTGDGPGEFRSISSVEVVGDSLWVFDARLQRLSMFTTDGQFVSAKLLPRNLGITAEVVGRLGAGAWYAKEQASVQPIGVGRDRTLVVGLDASLARNAEITSLPDYVTGSLSMGSRVETRFAAYSPRVLIDHAGGCLWVMSSDDTRLEIFGPDGRRVRRAMVPWNRRPITEEHMRAWAIDVATELELTDFGALTALMGFPHQPYLPLYNELVADDQGLAWLQEFEPPSGYGKRWIVVDAAGGMVARVELPDAVRILEVRRNTIFALARTAAGKQLVRTYQVNRAGAYASPRNDLCTTR
jgi:hypothetical protein